ncbi:MAG: hypothetical protein EOP86_20610, partial [Verrucomicrobiaceae bacterium]
MSLLNFKEFYGQSLAVKTPWRVTEVSIDSEKRQVRILLECARGVSWANPETRERAEIKAWQERTWRYPDMFEFETGITAKMPRIIPSGGCTMMVSVPWAQTRGRFTRRFEKHVIELLSQCRTVNGAVRLADITEDPVDGVLKRDVERGLLRRAKNIGLDEKAIRKGHRSAAILPDVDSGAIIDVAEDHKREATVKLLTQLPERSLAGIEAVALDMWPAFIGAVEGLVAKVPIAFDNCCRSGSTLREACGWLSPFGRLHIKKHLNEAVDKVRKAENRELGAAGSGVLNTKYQWLKNLRNQWIQTEAAFQELLVQNLKTGTSWTLKEDFDRMRGYTSMTWAVKLLWNWTAAARGSLHWPKQRTVWK